MEKKNTDWIKFKILRLGECLDYPGRFNINHIALKSIGWFPTRENKRDGRVRSHGPLSLALKMEKVGGKRRKGS